MPTIDQFTAVLKVDSSGFTSGINSATRSLGTLGKEFDKASQKSAGRFKNSLKMAGNAIKS